MKTFDEIIEYLNKHDDRVDYQVYPDEIDRSIQVQLHQEIFLYIDVKRYRIAFVLDKSNSLSFIQMKQFLQQLQQAVELGESLKKFLQSS